MKKSLSLISILLFLTIANTKKTYCMEFSLNEEAILNSISKALRQRETHKFSVDDLYSCCKSILNDYGILENYEFKSRFIENIGSYFNIYDFYNNPLFQNTYQLREFLLAQLYNILKCEKNYKSYYVEEDVEEDFHPTIIHSPKQLRKDQFYRTKRSTRKNKKKKRGNKKFYY